MSEGRKDDDGKLRWDLLPLHLIEKVVEVYTFGAQKYAPNSWQNLEDGYNRYKAAMLRHLTAHEKGEVIDSDSKLPHLVHVAWNAIALMHFGMKERSVVFDVKCNDEASPRLEDLQNKTEEVLLNHADECGERGELGKVIYARDEEPIVKHAVFPNIGQKVKFEFEHRDGIYRGIGEVVCYMLNSERESFTVREIDEFGVDTIFELNRTDIKEIIE